MKHAQKIELEQLGTSKREIVKRKMSEGAGSQPSELELKHKIVEGSKSFARFYHPV